MNHDHRHSRRIANHLREELNSRKSVLLYAYNSTGRTRLSTDFKNLGKVVNDDGEVTQRDTLYFNAYTEDLFRWDKQHPVLTRKDFMGAHEWCFYGWREGAAHRWFGPNNVPDIWPIKKVNPQSMEHLTQKPVELAARAMSYSSRPGENVLDLFGGSGSTLIAAEQLGRHAYLMEIDPPYADLIIDRWQRFTGKAAVHAATGAAFPKPPPATMESMR